MNSTPVNVSFDQIQQSSLNVAHQWCPWLIGKTDGYLDWLFTDQIKFNNSDLIGQYACQQVQLGQIVLPNLTYALAIVRIIGGIFGVLGSICALITFSSAEYKNSVTMIYHRFINSLEIVNSCILIHGGIDYICVQLWRYEIWVLTTVKIILRLRGSLLFMVNMTVLWVTCERIAACYANLFFTLVNTKKVARLIILLAVLISIACVLPNGFTVDYIFNNSTGLYEQIESPMTRTTAFAGYSVFYAVFTLVHSFLLLITSLIAVSGFIHTAKRKLNLIASTSHHRSQSEKELLKQYSINLQLCVLQMCECLPFTINEILLASYLIHYNYITKFIPSFMAPRMMQYSQALRTITTNRINYYLQFFINSGVVISHCFRFYLYMLCSSKARGSFCKQTKRAMSSVLTTKPVQSQQPQIRLFERPGEPNTSRRDTLKHETTMSRRGTVGPANQTGFHVNHN